MDASTLKPPGKGKKLNKWYVMGGGAVVLIMVYEYRKSASNAAAATTTATDPTATDPTAYDPNAYSQYGYDQYGYGTSGTGSLSAYSYIDPTTGLPIGLGTTTPTVLAPTTNAAWAQQASGLLAQHGYAQMSVDAALGKYLSNQNLTADEYSIVQAAIGLEGSPPTAVPAPHVAPPAGQTTAAKTAPNGYYRLIPQGSIFQVQTNIRYPITPTTWNKIKKGKPLTPILSNNRVMALPLGKAL